METERKRKWAGERQVKEEKVECCERQTERRMETKRKEEKVGWRQRERKRR